MSKPVSSQRRDGCPGAERLSEWVDGERPEPGLAAHLEECSSCAAVVRAYQQVDDVIRTALRPPPNLAARIKARCRQAPEIIPPLMRWQGALLRYAAVVAATAALLAALSYQLRQPAAAPPAPEPANNATPMPTPPTPAAPGLGQPGAFAVATHIPATKPTRPDNLPTLNRFRPDSPLAQVSRTNRRVESFRPTVLPRRFVRGDDAIVPARVEHVWTVDGLETGADAFLNQLPPDSSCSAGDRIADGIISFTVLLSDESLQALVDELAEQGWPLLTPQMPQPGIGHEMNLSGDTVSYHVKLVATAP